MFGRQTAGSVVCVACGRLVGVRDEVCLNCGRRNPALWGYAPLLRRLGADLGFVKLVIGGCAALFVISLLLDPGGIASRGLFSLFSPSLASLYLLGASGAAPVFEYGRFWTLLSAGWLHGSALHIAFNMLWVRQIAPAVADLYGAGRMIVIYTAGSVLGFLASSAAGAFLPFLPRFLQGAGFTVGASAPIFGLLGALVWYGHRTGARAMRQQVWGWALTMFVFGFVMPGIDNWAHAGGFGGGWLAARLLDPLQPERLKHVLWALLCLAATAAAVAYSAISAFALAH